MCGRFTHKRIWVEVVAYYRITDTGRNLAPRYNIAADGYHEWKPIGPKEKQPYRITLTVLG
ncbi:MAG: hypothetical protein GEU87_14530 [Alphaproteobacteria bacterium]|nr:hypothetical protein [Alphaproteobacteria bacterium]